MMRSDGSVHAVATRGDAQSKSGVPDQIIDVVAKDLLAAAGQQLGPLWDSGRPAARIGPHERPVGVVVTQKRFAQVQPHIVR